MAIDVILFGATGMVGEGVLHECLLHPDVASVLAVSRRPVEVQHPKLKELIHKDFFDYTPIERELSGYGACFFCLGVSSVGMKEEDYRRVTYDLTMSAARTLSRLNPAMTFCYVSGAGTDSTEQGRLMWARVKGKTENDLGRLPFKAVYLFRPGLIKPTPGLRRSFRIARVMGLLYPLWYLLLPKYVCTLRDLGLAMIHVAISGSPRRILESNDITNLAKAEYRL